MLLHRITRIHHRFSVVDQPVVREAEPLSADGEERLAGGVHEDDLGLIACYIVIDAEYYISFPVEHRKTFAIEEQRLPPDSQDQRVPTTSW